MGIFNQLGKAVQSSRKLLQAQIESYIGINAESKQLVLKPKAVLLLCQQATTRVEKLTTLEPDLNEGLIAVIEHQKIKAKLHFTPEKLLLKDGVVEGQLRLLSKPDIESSSMIYRTLISGWSLFLGGYIPNEMLPEGVRIEGDIIYYVLPKSQLKLVSTLFGKLEDGSSLSLSLKQGELQIQSAVKIDWSDIDFQTLLQLLNNFPKTSLED